MNIEARERLEGLVKQITETGEWILDKDILKTIKHYCKQNNSNVEATYTFMMAQLHKEQAQIRYSCLQLCEELFKRSYYFRTLVTDELPTMVQLIVGIRGHSLPPPASIAIKLRQYAIALIKNWYQHFGEQFRALSIAYDYLSHNGFLERDPQSLQSIHARDLEKSSKEARMKAIEERRYDQIKTDINDHLDLIQESIKNMESCFEILIPKNDSLDDSLDFDALIRGDMEISSSGETDYKKGISHGLATNRYTITIDMSKDNPLLDQVHESEDNRVVYEQLREAYKVLETKQSKQVNNWINSLVRMEYVDKTEKENYVKQLIQAKNDIAEVIHKVKLLGIELPPDRRRSSTNGNQVNEQDEDDDEFLDELFEEVEIPDLPSSPPPSSSEHTIPSAKLPPSQRIFPLSYEPIMTEDVTYSGGQVLQQQQQQDSSALDNTDNHTDSSSVDIKGKGKQKHLYDKNELLKRAPFVEWGDDLYYWDKKSVQFNTSGIEFSHRFMGVGEGTNEMPEHLLEDLRKRSVYYKTEVPKKIKACRYPLHNGGLCPRRDLVTCPFHGKIIPRDELGRPVQPVSKEEQSQPSSSTIVNNKEDKLLWQEIEDEVMQQVGQPRIEPGKRSKRAKKDEHKKKRALIDVRKKPDTPYTRLAKRMDSRETRRMVDEALEYERSMKSRDRKASTWR
ncbi:uncharacterized protein BX664DRAFT_310820 [Halteromyces radiatus]|uniref:uncharacterized protein n=1 Tax=Halteromyces radiatus TaxID=101107 RepID=UPI00221E467B|nr:uncharacterized protein BX664DRAFT_310820 [Halteromyces radiatus]KAI8099896.1 hypothetical protein BX664DRAFT_310820 [Halteromyces radiatus]